MAADKVPLDRVKGKFTLPAVIRSFKSRALKALWDRDNALMLHGPVGRIKLVLDRLSAATRPEEMNLPGFHFHQLSGDRKGIYSVRITGNWRITFEWEGEDAVRVDYEDYH
jgi:proteic killer suppression protein